MDIPLKNKLITKLYSITLPSFPHFLTNYSKRLIKVDRLSLKFKEILKGFQNYIKIILYFFCNLE